MNLLMNSPNLLGYLTTHVLDITRGLPAPNLQIELWSLQSSEHLLLKKVQTNHQGRTDAPLLQGSEFVVGTYELIFTVGSYFRQQGLDLPTPTFLDQIPIRFSIADPKVHYHIPLLVSPWAYSTYRGS